MPPDEGLALYEAARDVAVDGPFLEVGSYCGRSAIYLGAAAAERARLLFALDHHRGSEENQPGWEHHDPAHARSSTNRKRTRAVWSRNLHGWYRAGWSQSGWKNSARE